MVPSKCTTCNTSPNVRINKLDYCNTCFERQLLYKVARNFRGLPPGSRVLVYLDGTTFSLAMAHAVSMLRNKSLHRFSVLVSGGGHDDFLRGLGLDRHDDEIDRRLSRLALPPADRHGHNPLPKEVMEAADEIGFDILVFQAHVEQESVIALNSICGGNGVTEYIDMCSPRLCRARVLNVFGGVKSKEICYYHHLNRGAIPTANISRRRTRAEDTLCRFVNTMENRNSLALFNVLSVVKKIASCENSDVSD